MKKGSTAAVKQSRAGGEGSGGGSDSDLQRGQILRIVALVPAVEDLQADAAAGTAHVLAAAIIVHPNQPETRLPT